MSDAFWTAIFVSISTIVVAWIQSRQQKQLKAIHGLVNSAMGRQLKISAIALRRLAKETHHTDDIAAADEAEAMFQEHDARQKKVTQALGE